MEFINYIRLLLAMKIRNTRTYALLVLQCFILYLYMKPVVGFSRSVQYPVSPWSFPFIISNIYFAFLFLLEVIYYFSNVPFMQYVNMYQVIRVGRKRWALGQMLVIFLQSVFLIAVNYLFSILWLGRNCEWTAQWGKALHTAALTNAASHYEFLFGISYDTMQKFTPLGLTAFTFLVGSLVICFLGLFMFLLSLVWNRMAAVAGAVILATGIYIVENVHPLLSRKVAMFVPTSWIRVGNIGVKLYDGYVLPSMQYILIVLLGSIAVMGAIILWRVQKIEFEWTNEDE